MVLRLLFCLLPFSFLSAQSDSLLRAFLWWEAGTGYTLKFTPDGTFEQDRGEDVRSGRYLMGRYTLDSTDAVVTLSVDYLLGKRHLPNRYRRKRDFYLDYRIDTLATDTLVLTDLLTGERRRFGALPLSDGDDPARRRIPKPELGELKLPEDWGG